MVGLTAIFQMFCYSGYQHWYIPCNYLVEMYTVYIICKRGINCCLSSNFVLSNFISDRQTDRQTLTESIYVVPSPPFKISGPSLRCPERCLLLFHPAVCDKILKLSIQCRRTWRSRACLSLFQRPMTQLHEACYIISNMLVKICVQELNKIRKFVWSLFQPDCS